MVDPLFFNLLMASPPQVLRARRSGAPFVDERSTHVHHRHIWAFRRYSLKTLALRSHDGFYAS
jgi:hypothetical protein